MDAPALKKSVYGSGLKVVCTFIENLVSLVPIARHGNERYSLLPIVILAMLNSAKCRTLRSHYEEMKVKDPRSR